MKRVKIAIKILITTAIIGSAVYLGLVLKTIKKDQATMSANIVFLNNQRAAEFEFLDTQFHDQIKAFNELQKLNNTPAVSGKK